MSGQNTNANIMEEEIEWDDHLIKILATSGLPCLHTFSQPQQQYIQDHT